MFRSFAASTSSHARSTACFLLVFAISQAACGSNDGATDLSVVNDASVFDEGAPDLAAFDAASDAATGTSITGKVVGASNSPATSAKVLIQGKMATTSATGTFTISGVTVPYDVTVLLPTGAYSPPNAPLSTTFVGLSGTSPLLSISTKAMPASATIAGNLSGGAGFPNVVGASYQVHPTGPSVGGSVSNGGNQTQTGPYQVEPRWAEDQATQTITIHALQYIPATGIPTSYPGYGTTTAFATPNSASLTTQNIILAAATTSTVDGTIVVPAGFTLLSRYLNAAPGLGGSFHWSETSASTSFSYTAPNLGMGTLTVTVSASGPNGEFASAAASKIPPAGATGLTITLPTPAVQTAPATNATGANPTTAFSWTASPTAGCVYWVQLTSSVTNAPQYTLYTTATTVHFPDLSAASITPPVGGAYQWQVNCIGPYPTIDSAVGAVGFGGLDYSVSSPQSAFLMQ